MSKTILAINPGSTSTKIAVFEGEEQLFLKNIKHPAEEIEKFAKITDQYEFRKNIIIAEVEQAGIDLKGIKIIVGRGGLVKPISSGVYEVNDALLNDLRIGYSGEHASNLGGIIAYDLAKTIGDAKAVIADPVVVDELQPLARISGHPAFERSSIFHALNQKAIARTFARENGKGYDELNLIVAHLGGGISVGAHLKGKVVDVNQALDGDGPFSPERTGTLPAGQLAKACFSGEYTFDQIKKMICGKGGYVGYLDTNDAYAVEKAAEAGDEKAKLIQDALSYQVAKEIGACAAVLKGKVDGILLTGGIAYGKEVVNFIKDMVSFIAPVTVYPGEDEMKALAMNGLRVLDGDAELREYK